MCAGASRVARSRTTIDRQHWRLPPLGANRARSRMLNSVASGSSSSVNSRAANVVRMTSKSSMIPSLAGSPEDTPLGYDRGGRRREPMRHCEAMRRSAMRGWVRLVALAIVVVAALPAAAVGQVRGGTIRGGMDADTTTMDPHRSTAAVDRQGHNQADRQPVDTDAPG